MTICKHQTSVCPRTSLLLKTCLHYQLLSNELKSQQVAGNFMHKLKKRNYYYPILHHDLFSRYFLELCRNISHIYCCFVSCHKLFWLIAAIPCTPVNVYLINRLLKAPFTCDILCCSMNNRFLCPESETHTGTHKHTA